MNKQNLKIAIGAGALLLIGGYLVYEWYKSEKDNNSKECTKKFNADCNDEHENTSVSTVSWMRLSLLIQVIYQRMPMMKLRSAFMISNIFMKTFCLVLKLI